MKLVIELVLVNEKQIGNKREIKLAIPKRQLRQAARHVARSRTRPIIVQKSPICPLAKSAQELGRLIEIPAIRLQVADDLGHLLEIEFAASPDFVSRQVVDRIERRDVDAQTICFSAKRTDAGCNIQDCFATKLLEIERKIASVLFQCAAQQHDFVQNKALFHRERFSVKIM